MKFADDLIGDVDNLLEHVDLLFAPDDANLCVFEEGVGGGSVVQVEVNLGADFPEQDEITFQNKMHLNFIEEECLLFILRLFLFPLTKVIYSLQERLILLNVNLKLINCLLI